MIGLVDGDVLLHFALWKSDTLEKFESKLEYFLEEWALTTFSDELIVAIGNKSGYNYRYDLYPEYKQIPTRVNGRDNRVEFFEEARNRIESLSYAVAADDIEADDLIGHWATQLKQQYCIISVDKDLYQIPGYHYNPRNQLNLVVANNKAKSFFLYQLLVGDSIDNIPGIYGLGPKKADKIVSNCRTVGQLAREVKLVYEDRYGTNWIEYFLSNAKMLYIQREPNKHFNLQLFKKEYLDDSSRI